MACMAAMQIQQWESYSAKLTQQLSAINRRRDLSAKAVFAKRILESPQFAKFPQENGTHSVTVTRVKASISRVPQAVPPPQGAAGSGGGGSASSSAARDAGAAVVRAQASANAQANAAARSPTPPSAGPGPVTANEVATPGQNQPAAASAQPTPGVAAAAADAAAARAAAAAVDAAAAGAGAHEGERAGDAVGAAAQAAQAGEAPGLPAAAARGAVQRENAWIRYRLGAILKIALLLLVFEISTIGMLVYFYGAILYISGAFDGIVRQFFANNFPQLEEQLHNIRDGRVPADAPPVENRPGPVWRALYQSVFMFFVTLAPWWESRSTVYRLAK